MRQEKNYVEVMIERGNFNKGCLGIMDAQAKRDLIARGWGVSDRVEFEISYYSEFVDSCDCGARELYYDYELKQFYTYSNGYNHQEGCER